jgi:hypothetical protein
MKDRGTALSTVQPLPMSVSQSGQKQPDNPKETQHTPRDSVFPESRDKELESLASAFLAHSM